LKGLTSKSDIVKYVPSSIRSSSHSCFSPPTASCYPHQWVCNPADTDSSSAVRTHTVKPSSQVQSASGTQHTTCRCLPATAGAAGQLQGSTEHYPADVNGSGLVFNPPRSTAPFLSATIVLSTILHHCSTSLGIAIPDLFSNSGISGLRNANPGIPGLNPGIESLILN